MRLKTLLAFTVGMVAWAGAQAVAEPKVVASIKPVHSLVAALMEGVGEPDLLVSGAASPHSYSMRPSQARALQNADLVFWIGPGMETFMPSALEAHSKEAQAVALVETPGITEYELREGGAFESHDHSHEAHHDDHDSHDHAHEAEGHGDDHTHDEAHSHEDDHGHEDNHAAEGHEDHDHGSIDLHLWLDPENARAMARYMAEKLAAADEENAAVYKGNLAELERGLDNLTAELQRKLAPVRNKPYVVFHDAYRYFEERFGLQPAGSITINPETMPGAKRLQEIKEKLAEIDAACVFSEPQFDGSIVEVVIEGTQARAGELDPVGAGIDDGPGLYPALLRGLGDGFAGCLDASRG
ncbi:zinc ABC transporter substrate-binding protein [Nitratireductor basaltis]|uniref:High-affinity zinc uptake system protein ZnuA n=1 Tax=Nitratireductor basaltis TaxID=472175 RepID=A0A084U604_9HYPH|nr:zinc ABC transporter substrate-binding protein [Nitratireductor basaltis]KFB08390.1 Zinc ABC transporter periplasmic zinc-binding protein [Nitratireductor basaltis]